MITCVYLSLLLFTRAYLFLPLFNHACVIVSGLIKGAACATNVMYPCGFICIPVVSTLCRMNLIKNNYNGTGTRQRSLKAKHCY